jgi:hypothetical protein
MTVQLTQVNGLIGESGVGTVTSVSGAGIATGTVTTSGSITVAGSGNTTTAATANANLAAAPNNDILIADGSGNVKDSGTLLSSLAPKASPTFTGNVTMPSATNGEFYYCSGGFITQDANLDDGATTANTLTYKGSAGLAITGSAINLINASVGIILFENSTAATSGTTGQNSPKLQLEGQVYTGSVSAGDVWQHQIVYGAGNNPTSIYQIQHSTSGGTGASIFEFALPGSTSVVELVNLTAATSGANQSSPLLEIFGASWSGAASALDGFTIQAVPASGSNPTNQLQIKHSTTNSGGSSIAFGSTQQFVVSGAGNFATITGKATSGSSVGGVPIVVYENLASAQAANWQSGSATTVYTPTAACAVRITISVMTTQAATSSSTVPSFTVGWTDVGGIARTNALIASSSGNVTTYMAQGTLTVYTNTSTAVTVTSASYASSGGTALNYAVSVIAELM